MVVEEAAFLNKKLIHGIVFYVVFRGGKVVASAQFCREILCMLCCLFGIFLK
jgi:hypothetical protein